MDDELEDELTKALEGTPDREDDIPVVQDVPIIISPPPAKRRRRSKGINALPPPDPHQGYSHNNKPPKRLAIDPFSRLSDQCVLHITSRLSPEDLCSLAQTSTHFSTVTAEPTLWRALYFARWAGGPSEIEQQGEARLPESFSWKSLYFARDKTELDREAREAPEAFRDIYLQMVTARRSEPLTAAQAAGLLAGPGSASGQGQACFQTALPLLEEIVALQKETH